MGAKKYIITVSIPYNNKVWQSLEVDAATRNEIVSQLSRDNLNSLYFKTSDISSVYFQNTLLHNSVVVITEVE